MDYLKIYPDSIALRIDQIKLAEIEQDNEKSLEVVLSITKDYPRFYYKEWLKYKEETLKSFKSANSLVDVKTLMQKKDFCGPNSLSLVAQFYGLNFSQDDIAEDIWDQGASNFHMLEWVKKEGLPYRVFSGHLNEIKKCLDQKIPIITSRAWESGGHYLIIVGYSEENEELILRDPASPYLERIPFSDLDEIFCIESFWCLIFTSIEQEKKLKSLNIENDKILIRNMELMDVVYKSHPDQLIERIREPESEYTTQTLNCLLNIYSQRKSPKNLKEIGLKLIKRHPKNKVVRAKVVQAWCSYLPPDEVIEYSRENLEISSHYLTLSNHVRLCIQVGEINEAEKWAKKLLEWYPGQAYSYLTYARLLVDLNLEESAEEYINISEEIDYGDPYLLTYLAQTQTRMGKTGEAIRNLEKALSIREQYNYAMHQLAIAYERREEYETSKRLYREALTAHSWDSDAYDDYYQLLRDLGLYQEAIQVLEEGIQKAESPKLLQLNLAYDLKSKGNYEESLRKMEELHEAYPDYLGAMVGRATLLIDFRRLNEAKKYLEEAVGITHTWEYPYNKLLLCYDHLALEEESIALMWKWTKENLESSSFDNKLYERLKAKGKEKELTDFLEQAAEDASIKSPIYCRLSSLYLNISKYKSARNWAKASIKINSKDSWAYALLGQSYEKSGEEEKAIKCFRKAIQLWPAYLFAIKRLVSVYAKNRDPLAFEYLDKLIAVDSNQLDFYVEIYAEFGLVEEAYQKINDSSFSVRDSYLIQMQSGFIKRDIGQWEKAKEHFESAKSSNRNLSWVNAWLGICSFHLGQDEEAMKCYQESLQVDPDYMWGRNKFCEFYLSKGQYEKALELALEGLDRQPNDYDMQQYAIDIFLKKGQSEEGYQRLRPYFEKVLDKGDFLCSLSQLFKQNDQPERAIKELREALRIDPENTWAMRLMALNYEDINLPEEGERWIRKCLKKDPHDERAWGILVDSLIDRGAIEEAGEIFAKRVKKYSDNEQIPAQIYRWVKDSAYSERGIEFLQAFLKRTSIQNVVYYYESRIYEDHGELEHSLEAINKALEHSPHYLKGLEQRSDLFDKLGETEKAIQDLELLLDLSPGESNAIKKLLNYLVGQGDFDKGFQYLKQSLKTNPSSNDLYYAVNNFCEQMDRMEDAIDLLNSLKGRNQNLHVLNCYIGTSYLTAQKVEEAIECFNQALEIFPNYSWALSRLGDSYYLLGDDDRAIEYFEACILSQKDYEYAYSELNKLYAQRNEWDQCWRVLKEKFINNIDSISSQFDFQEYAIERQRYEDFEEVILAEVQKARAPHILYTRLAHAYLCKEEWEKANQFINRALELNEHDDWSNSRKGEILYQQDQFKEALGYFEKSYSIWPKSSFVIGRIAEIYKINGRKEERVSFLVKNILKFPDMNDIQSELLRYETKKEGEEALKALSELEDQLKNKEILYLNLAFLSCKLKKFKEGKSYYIKGLKDYPTSFISFHNFSNHLSDTSDEASLFWLCLEAMTQLNPVQFQFVEKILHLDAIPSKFIGSFKMNQWKPLLNENSKNELLEKISVKWISLKFNKTIAPLSPSTILVGVLCDYYRRKKYKQCSELGQKCIHIFPNIYYFHYLTLIAHARLKQYKKMDQYIRVIQLENRYMSQIDELLGLQALEKGDLEQAEYISMKFFDEVDEGYRYWKSSHLQFSKIMLEVKSCQ